jgi:hypothetical protein
MINIGRPDKLQVTINGSAVPALGDGKRAIKDVPISAAALQARGTTTPAAAPAAAPATVAPTTDAKPSKRAGSNDIPDFFRQPSDKPTASATPRTVATPDPVSLPAAAPTSAP